MYDYNHEKAALLTDKGQRQFLKVRDHVQHLLAEAGAFMMQNAWKPICADSWFMLACVDRLVELGEIRELPYNAAGQHRVFIDAGSRL